MLLYQKYISNLLLRFFGAIAMTFTFVVILGQFLRLINRYIGKGTNLHDVVYMLMLVLPSLLVYISPIAIFCTIIIVYHKIIIDNEMVTLEATGLSKFSIAKIFLRFAIIITIMAYIITLIINPLAKREFQNQKLTLRDGFISNLLEEKTFNNIAKNLTIYLDSKDDKNQLFGVAIYDKSRGKNVIISAEKAYFLNENNDAKIMMFNGTRQEINKDNQLDVLNFSQSKLDLISSKMEGMNRSYTPEEWMITDLIFNNTDDPVLKNIIHTEIHQRFSWPLLNLTLASIALLAISSGSFSRKWSSKTIIYGIALSALVIFLHFAIESIAKHRHYLSILLYVNMILFIYGSVYLLKKSSNTNTPLSIKDLFPKLSENA